MKLNLELTDDQVAEIVEQLEQRLAERQTSAADDGGWLNVESAAAYIDSPPSRIHDLTSLGRLRCKKDGRRSLYKREWLDAVLEERAS